MKIRKKIGIPFFHEKIMFFRDATRKTRTTCKMSTFFEDLKFLNPKSHLIVQQLQHSSIAEITIQLDSEFCNNLKN